MPYERSQEIERRLQDLVALIRSAKHSAPSLAKALDISQPTVARCLAALRDRGYEIRCVKEGRAWHYELLTEPATVSEG